MKYCETVLDLIGNTPMVKLNRMVDESMATVLIKMEQLNPGGSVKDRMAVHMIRRAEERGDIKPGDTLVESTSGNTGLGLAMAAAVKGVRVGLGVTQPILSYSAGSILSAHTVSIINKNTSNSKRPQGQQQSRRAAPIRPFTTSSWAQ